MPCNSLSHRNKRDLSIKKIQHQIRETAKAKAKALDPWDHLCFDEEIRLLHRRLKRFQH